jgi:hypothetical protein
MNQEGIEIEILLDYKSDDDEDFKARQGKKLYYFTRKGIIPCEKL